MSFGFNFLFLIFSFTQIISANFIDRGAKVFVIEDLQVECDYQQVSSPFEGSTDNFYSCDVLTQFGYSIVNIISANDHADSRLHADVDLIEINELETAILPQGFAGIFENVKGLKISKAGLRSIAKSDLEPFVVLKYLSLTGNPIQFLPPGLFSANSLLDYVDISDNMLVFIDATAFDGLSLKFLKAEGLQCFLNTGAASTPTAIANLIQNIKSECSKTPILLGLYSSYILNFVTERKTSEDQQNKISNLNSNLETCEADKKKFEDEIERLNEDCLPPSTTCKFVEDISEGYQCMGRKISIKSEEDQKVSWNGSHLSSKGNSDVESLLIKFQEIQILPLEVGKTFNNLKSFIVDSSNLKKLERNDFKTLENLLKLSITGNEISSIESGTFDILTKLKNLDLSGNQILTFPSKVFAALEALEILNLSENFLTSLKVDLIPASNKIQKFHGNNNKLTTLDIYFVWRLKNCKFIDFSGNLGCNVRFDGQNFQSFQEFFKIVLEQC